MIGEAELLQRLRNREKNSIDEANDYETVSYTHLERLLLQ